MTPFQKKLNKLIGLGSKMTRNSAALRDAHIIFKKSAFNAATIYIDLTLNHHNDLVDHCKSKHLKVDEFLEPFRAATESTGDDWYELVNAIQNGMTRDQFLQGSGLLFNARLRTATRKANVKAHDRDLTANQIDKLSYADLLAYCKSLIKDRRELIRHVARIERHLERITRRLNAITTDPLGRAMTGVRAAQPSKE